MAALDSITRHVQTQRRKGEWHERIDAPVEMVPAVLRLVIKTHTHIHFLKKVIDDFLLWVIRKCAQWSNDSATKDGEVLDVHGTTGTEKADHQRERRSPTHRRCWKRGTNFGHVHVALDVIHTLDGVHSCNQSF